MKKLSVKIVSVILAFSLIFGGFSAMGSAAAVDVKAALTHAGVAVVDGIVSHLLAGINFLVPDKKGMGSISDRDTSQFYKGTETMLDEPADNAVWELGYAKTSLVPDDWQTKDYFLGGFISMQNGMSNKVEEVIDDMQVRVIAVSDGSGRGVSVFANIDSIGVSNGDIRAIRSYLSKLDTGVEISSITVTSTHCHSCIDTQGLWTNLLSKLGKNLVNAYLRTGNLEKGVDTEYMDFLRNAVANTMAEAIKDMKKGTMTYAVKSLDEEYFNNKNRKSSTSVLNDMTRFVFTPFEVSETVKPTMIVNIAAHPDIAGLAVDETDNGRQLSGDYVYYMGDTIENAGYNFMFFNGAIAGIYAGRGLSNDNVPLERRYQQSERYGREMGQIALNLTNTYEVINANADWDKINAEMALAGDRYTLWFDETWEPAEEKELEPVLNTLFKEVKIKVTNPLIQLVGKLDLANYDVYKENHRYYIFTEIGYMEFGGVKIALMPGEIVQDLVAGGGSLTAEGSYSGEDFGYKTIRELFGEDAIAFGLANDAIGYVVPDNDYSMAILDDHYQELISLGNETASTIMKGYAEIAAQVNR